MATQSARAPLPGVGLFWVIFWAIVLAGAVFFIAETIAYIITTETDPDVDPITARQAIVYAHGALAIPILFVAPLQFHPGIRSRNPRFHRWTGRVFLTASLLTASLAVYLSFGYDPVASRPAIFFFGLLWVFFSVSAWLSVRRKDFVAHRAFMIRAVAVGFAFVWVRMMRVAQDWLFFYIENEEMRLVAREYMCFIVPLVAVEIWLTYWPALKRALRRQS